MGNTQNFDERLQYLFKEAFGVDRVDDTTSVDNVDDWDSMGHVALILALEREFGISISPIDAVDLTSIKKIRSYLGRKE